MTEDAIRQEYINKLKQLAVTAVTEAVFGAVRPYAGSLLDGQVCVPKGPLRPRWPRIGGVFGAKWLQEVRRGCVAGKRSPLGEASIASGYTPPALAGAMPPPP